MQPLVSICIPTYNRADCLRKTIESIICQSEFISGIVEIVISDNASSDNTMEVCAKYNHYSNFHYFRNKDNVRDRNFPIVLSKATGKLRKLNNDTFILNEGSLCKLCMLARKYDETRPVLFLLNKNVEDDILDFHDFVLKVGYLSTWLPSHTFWEDDCENVSNDFLGCDLFLWQVRKIYEIANIKNNIVVVGGVFGYTFTPQRKDISYGLYKVFYQNYFLILDPYIKKGIISYDDKYVIERQLLFDFFLPWIITSEFSTDLQLSRKEDLKQAVFTQYQDKPYWKKFKVMYNFKVLKKRIKRFLKRIIGKNE